MKIVRLIMNAMPLAFGYCCLATVIVQAGGGMMLLANGKLTRGKSLRYAAIAYGIDIADLPADRTPDGNSDNSDHDLTPEQLLAKRVDNLILADRRMAMRQETDTIRSMEKELKADRDRRATVRKNFRAYLDELEKEVVVASLGDVKRTLENLAPRQAKDIILRTLEDEGADEGDDVVADVVTIIKEMPEGKLKKILGEFRSAAEQEMLHRILMDIGDLASEETP